MSPLVIEDLLKRVLDSGTDERLDKEYNTMEMRGREKILVVPLVADLGP